MAANSETGAAEPKFAGIPHEKVMVNGAAIALLERMVANLRDDFNRRFDEHERQHDGYSRRSHQQHTKIFGRIHALEAEDQAEDEAARIRKAHRDGQLSWIRWAMDNKAWLAPLLAAGGGWLVGLFTGTPGQ